MSDQAQLAETLDSIAGRLSLGILTASEAEQAVNDILAGAAALREAERRYESEVKLANSLGRDLEALSDEMDGRLAAAERRAKEAESKLATATDTIRSLTALASEREAT